MSRLSLGARLSRTVGDPSCPPVELPDEPQAGSSSLDRATLDRYSRLRQTAHALTAGGEAASTPFDVAIPGVEVRGAHGPTWVVETRYDLEALHGACRIGAFYERTLDHVPRLTADPRLEGRDGREALFLDIEATGLDHGAGTQAFLIGLGTLDGDELVVRQHVLRNPGEERAMLQEVVDAVDEHPLMVSFNGKSYDLTVLQSRLVLQRFYTARDCDLKLRPHLDLLHLARNLHRDRFENTSLGMLERRVLGFERHDDVPGHLVPTLWFHYLRTGDAGPLAGVMKHNLDDVVSMVVLADQLLMISVEQPERPRPARVTANLGRLLLRRREPAAALRVLRAAASSSLGAASLDDTDRLLLRLTAVAARRCAEPKLHRAALERLITDDPTDVDALTALSIVEARGARDLGRALELARAAWRACPDDTTGRRVDRLEARIARHRRPAVMVDAPGEAGQTGV